MWDILIMNLPEGREREKESERIFEKIIAENFPNLMTDINIHILEVKRPKRINSKGHTPKILIVKLSKAEDKRTILKTAHKKSDLLCTRDYQ